MILSEKVVGFPSSRAWPHTKTETREKDILGGILEELEELNES